MTKGTYGLKTNMKIVSFLTILHKIIVAHTVYLQNMVTFCCVNCYFINLVIQSPQKISCGGNEERNVELYFMSMMQFLFWTLFKL